MPVYKKVNKDFFKIWSPEMAYVLGFFAADGYITVNKRGGQFWCMQITDQNLLVAIRRVIGSNHKIGVREMTGEKECTQYRLQIGSIEMCDDLRRLGYAERKSKCLVVPLIPQEYFSEFVRGYFDGDGNIWLGKVHKDSKTPNITIRTAFTSCSEDFLRRLRGRLDILGFTPGSFYCTRDFSRLSYSAKDSIKLYNLMYFCYPITDLYLKRKKKIFEKYIEMRR